MCGEASVSVRGVGGAHVATEEASWSTEGVGGSTERGVHPELH